MNKQELRVLGVPFACLSRALHAQVGLSATSPDATHAWLLSSGLSAAIPHAWRITNNQQRFITIRKKNSPLLFLVKGAVGCERKARPIRACVLEAVSALAFAEALAQAGVEWAFSFCLFLLFLFFWASKR